MKQAELLDHSHRGDVVDDEDEDVGERVWDCLDCRNRHAPHGEPHAALKGPDFYDSVQVVIKPEFTAVMIIEQTACHLSEPPRLACLALLLCLHLSCSEQ